MDLQIIQQKIFEIRGHKVMLDFDLAKLYEVETKRLNEAVKRNITRFPVDFMFQLTTDEWNMMWSQFATTSKSRRRKDSLPFAFTEHGVTMLASILNGEKAIHMNIAIVRAFIELKKFTNQYGEIIGKFHELGERIDNHDEQLVQIYDVLDKLLSAKAAEDDWENRERIGFKN